MKSLYTVLAESPELSDAAVLAEYRAQPPERKATPIQVVRSFMSDEMLMTPIKAVRDNPAAPAVVRYGLAEFVDGLANALTFNGLNDKVYGLATQLIPALATQIRDGEGKTILTQAQADAILGFVRDVPADATLADVAATRLALAKGATLVSVETLASVARNAGNAALSIARAQAIAAILATAAASIDALPAEVATP